MYNEIIILFITFISLIRSHIPVIKNETIDTCSNIKITFTSNWHVPTGKCVDASPLLVEHNSSIDGSSTVYIGSHSGIFLGIDSQSGDVKWSTQLTDRIESSACLSLCGKYVVVG